MNNPCTTCRHGKEITLGTPSRTEMRCFRVRRHRDARGPEKGVIQPGDIGFPAHFERDAVPEPHRVPGDKCGADGLHWEAAQ